MKSMMDDLHLRLFEARSLTIGREWAAENVQSSFWRFYRNDGDGAALCRETEEYPLEAGRLYFVPSDVRFTCRSVGPVRHFYVHFDIIGLPGTVGREWFVGPVGLERDAGLEAQTAALARAGDLSGFAGQCRVKGLLYAALALAFDGVPAETAARWRHSARDWAPVRPALDYIEAHLEGPLDNVRLAALCCVTEDYFIRRFRECAGLTPNRYVQERRVQRAAQMLLFTQEEIDQIAARTGFGNRAYFSRQFARHTGLSPAAYRKSTRV